MSQWVHEQQTLVIVTETLDDLPAQWLAQQVEMIRCPTDDPHFPELLAQAQGLIVRTYTLVNQVLLAKAPRLKVVGRGGVGLDNIDVPACRSRGIEVVYTPDANTQAVVEYVLGLMLDVYRPRPVMATRIDATQFHQVRKIEVGKQIDELTLGVVGFGRIGKRLGRAAAALGMKVLVTDLLPEATLRDQVTQMPGGMYSYDFVPASKLYAEADIITIHVDGRAENRHMINKEVLAQLKPTCLFINAARGFLIDNHALATWAKAHSQARVLLDVHEPEPPPADYPFYDLPNVRLYAHLASRTHTATQNMSWVVRDVVAVLQGLRPVNPAPKEMDK
ncbi:MAG: phosphoglycerate dehydrogenase [Phycisphaerales bacterium]|nr:phosphoglycerate dehydrogenase [Phycisphaerales bacterium]